MKLNIKAVNRANSAICAYGLSYLKAQYCLGRDTMPEVWYCANLGRFADNGEFIPVDSTYIVQFAQIVMRVPYGEYRTRDGIKRIA